MSVHVRRAPEFGDTRVTRHDTGDGKWWKPLRRPFRGQTNDGEVLVRNEGVILVKWVFRPVLVVADDPWYVVLIVRDDEDGTTLYPTPAPPGPTTEEET